MQEKITKDNHYLSQSYLKQWEFCDGKIWVYRTLVSNDHVPLWKPAHIKGTAFYTHLYSLLNNGNVSDQFENWFNTQFESPGLKILQKVLINDVLQPLDWKILVKYLALHDLRTPARLKEYLERASDKSQEMINNLIANFPKDFQDFRRQNFDSSSVEVKKHNFPLKVTPMIKEGEDNATLKIETDIGRASWLEVIKHQLENTSNILHEHQWTILHPSYGQSWFTSDKPVMRLNCHKDKYNFKGGWNSKGTEIIFPLSPEHLLYTKIGAKPPQRGTRLSIDKTNSINKLIVEHSFRNVYSKKRNNEIGQMKARSVNLEQFNYEKEFWQKWHLEQGKSENYFF